MKDNYRKLIAATSAMCLLLLTLWLGGRFLAPFSAVAVRNNDPIFEPVKEIAGYRNWTKVNPEQQIMHSRAAQDCVMVLSLPGEQVNGETNPHRDKYIFVYVNAIGREAMMEKLKPNFPQGSVIVKEKLPNKSSETPELLTVMIKREKGYNPESGDWEYMVTDGGGAKIQGRGKLGNCQGCHVKRPITDYIFRTYLPGDVYHKLK